MATAGQRRTRSERVAALELPPGRWERTWVELHRRAVLYRLALALGAAMLIAAATCAWDPPFSYRRGQPVPRDIVSRAAFEAVDLWATENAKRQALVQAPPVYALDPAPLDRCIEQLSAAMDEAASADSEADVRSWRDFCPPQHDPLDAESSSALFGRFRGAVASLRDPASLKRSIEVVLEPIRQRGLLGLRGQKPISPQVVEIQVYPAGRLSEAKPVKLSAVRLGDGRPLRQSLYAELSNDDLVEPVWNWLINHLPHVSTLTQDAVETRKSEEAAMGAVAPVVATFVAGQTLVEGGPDRRLDDDRVRVLRHEQDAVAGQRTLAAHIERLAAVTCLIVGVFALVAAYLHRRDRRLLASVQALAGHLLLLAATVLAASWLSVDMLRAEIVPLLLFAMAMTIAHRQELALVLSGTVVLMTAMATGYGLASIVVWMGTVLAVVLQLERIRSRTKLIYAALGAALAAAALTVVMAVVEGQPLDRTLWILAGCNAGWSVFAGFVMTVALPFVERMQWFGVLTDISLLELGDVSHPLLQQLVQRAPSTYNHSITVGSLAEAAAEAIGARGLLARIGAYYHDIGKMLKPGYFIENQVEAGNRHETLAPAMSTLVIIAHVKDGSDLARQHGLPQPLIDMIEQHHGTTLVEYFYNRANEQRRQTEPDGEVDESLYRYPGPRPQTKEAGVLMLADSVESASRSLVDPAPSRIESLVREIADRKLDDGQFDETSLTLCELRAVEGSMIKSLIANYHSRIKYPDQKTA